MTETCTPGPGDLKGQVELAKRELAEAFAAWEKASDAERAARKAYEQASYKLGDAEREVRNADLARRDAVLRRARGER